jgi:hypothetical protein
MSQHLNVLFTGYFFMNIDDITEDRNAGCRLIILKLCQERKLRCIGKSRPLTFTAFNRTQLDLFQLDRGEYMSCIFHPTKALQFG